MSLVYCCVSVFVLPVVVCPMLWHTIVLYYSLLLSGPGVGGVRNSRSVSPDKQLLTTSTTTLTDVPKQLSNVQLSLFCDPDQNHVIHRLFSYNGFIYFNLATNRMFYEYCLDSNYLTKNPVSILEIFQGFVDQVVAAVEISLVDFGIQNSEILSVVFVWTGQQDHSSVTLIRDHSTTLQVLSSDNMLAKYFNTMLAALRQSCHPNRSFKHKPQVKVNTRINRKPFCTVKNVAYNKDSRELYVLMVDRAHVTHFVVFDILTRKFRLMNYTWDRLTKIDIQNSIQTFGLSGGDVELGRTEGLHLAANTNMEVDNGKSIEMNRIESSDAKHRSTVDSGDDMMNSIECIVYANHFLFVCVDGQIVPITLLQLNRISIDASQPSYSVQQFFNCYQNSPLIMNKFIENKAHSPLVSYENHVYSNVSSKSDKTLSPSPIGWHNRSAKFISKLFQILFAFVALFFVILFVVIVRIIRQRNNNSFDDDRHQKSAKVKFPGSLSEVLSNSSTVSNLTSYSSSSSSIKDTGLSPNSKYSKKAHRFLPMNFHNSPTDSLSPRQSRNDYRSKLSLFNNSLIGVNSTGQETLLSFVSIQNADKSSEQNNVPSSRSPCYMTPSSNKRIGKYTDSPVPTSPPGPIVSPPSLYYDPRYSLGYYTDSAAHPGGFITRNKC